MHVSLKTWWSILKMLIGIGIVLGVAWQFWKILSSEELWRSTLQPRWPWLRAAVGFYILGLGCSALFWHVLLTALGQRPTLGATLRAYYIGQLGRYVPGKAV